VIKTHVFLYGSVIHLHTLRSTVSCAK